MPMLTTWVKVSPDALFSVPLRTASAKASIFCRSAMTSGMTSRPLRLHRRAAHIAQRHMQRRAAFRRIDDVAGEERGAALFDLGGAGEIEQKLARRAVEPVLRKIEQQIAERDMEIGEALRVARKQIGDRHIAEIEAMRFKRIERFGNFGAVHG